MNGFARIAEFSGYVFVERYAASPRYVLYDRAGGPVVTGDTRGDVFANALDAIDDHHETGLLGAYSIADFEAMELLCDHIAYDGREASRILAPNTALLDQRSRV